MALSGFDSDSQKLKLAKPSLVKLWPSSIILDFRTNKPKKRNKRKRNKSLLEEMVRYLAL